MLDVYVKQVNIYPITCNYRFFYILFFILCFYISSFPYMYDCVDTCNAVHVLYCTLSVFLVAHSSFFITTDLAVSMRDINI